MPFELRYSDEALEQLKRLRAFDRAAIVDQIEKVLMVNPDLEKQGQSEVAPATSPHSIQTPCR
jgi:mRNA-degrading endonuclease RelE of RelBE toxin-antitoxin system